MNDPIIKATWAHGQSIWLDFISRKLLDSGELAALISAGLRGLTSNPTIFQQAVSTSEDYDREIRSGVEHEWNPAQVFESLAVSDISRAADLFGKVYNESKFTDGFVSLEVSPKLAHDTQGTIEEAYRLSKKVNRPNLMIKVPGTEEGLPAISHLLRNGINVNVTLIFSLKQYEHVLKTYVEAVEARLHAGQDVTKLASVASFFVSRVDGAADKQLAEKGRADLAGKAAIANACLAYRHFQQVTSGERWQRCAMSGAQVQRPLWASTSTKNPAYPDVLYVKELVAKQTVNTMPPATLDAWRDHGTPEAGLERNLQTAAAVLGQIATAGVSIEKITEDLIEDGVKKFSDSFDQLLEAIQQKSRALASRKSTA